MSNSLSPTSESNTEVELRLATLENCLKFDERLKMLETELLSRGMIKASAPWWRDAKTITILGALMAAVLPAITAINGVLQNNRESQRLVVEQQDKIRQTYLDRVLRPGITEGEQQRIFGLLMKLQGDPEFQQWAQEEFQNARAKVDQLKKQKSSLEEENQILLNQIRQEKETSSRLSKQRSNSKIQKLTERVRKNLEIIEGAKRRTVDFP